MYRPAFDAPALFGSGPSLEGLCPGPSRTSAPSQYVESAGGVIALGEVKQHRLRARNGDHLGRCCDVRIVGCRHGAPLKGGQDLFAGWYDQAGWNDAAGIRLET
jgi:hypothetical protein